jgi:hypothetical protein
VAIYATPFCFVGTYRKPAENALFSPDHAVRLRTRTFLVFGYRVAMDSKGIGYLCVVQHHPLTLVELLA